MKKFIYSLLIINLSPLLFVNTFAQSCNNFIECDNYGRSAKNSGNLVEAYKYYKNACFMEVEKPLLNLRNNSCRSVTRISGELDDYDSAFLFFDKACTDGKDAGCFHLALLEEDRGNIQLAIKMMKPLCDRNYIIHKNVYTSGCNEYKRIKQKWESRNPRQPRDDTIQIPVLVITLVLPLIAAIFLILRIYFVSIVFSGLAFITYGYYEYGVSPYANIRIDLLLIVPLLLVSFTIFIVSAILFLKKIKSEPN